jgi:hypothetical protein
MNRASPSTPVLVSQALRRGRCLRTVVIPIVLRTTVIPIVLRTVVIPIE